MEILEFYVESLARLTAETVVADFIGNCVASFFYSVFEHIGQVLFDVGISFGVRYIVIPMRIALGVVELYFRTRSEKDIGLGRG